MVREKQKRRRIGLGLVRSPKRLTNGPKGGGGGVRVFQFSIRRPPLVKTLTPPSRGKFGFSRTISEPSWASDQSQTNSEPASPEPFLSFFWAFPGPFLSLFGLLGCPRTISEFFGLYPTISELRACPPTISELIWACPQTISEFLGLLPDHF